MQSHVPEHIDPTHCILTMRYAVYTPPMHEMILQIGNWIDDRRPGGYIYGASRLGKSRAVKWHLSNVLNERFGTTIPLVVWTRRSDSQPAEAAFWHFLLLASKFQFVDPTKPLKRVAGAHVCKERFISLANNAGQNYVVLLIDEAQEMTLKEWKWLVGLQNELDNEGYLLSVFSVGSHQLGYKHDYLASTGNAHIAARFMVSHARFHGIRSSAELGYVLTGYDVDSEWPAGSGKSFLQYFAPSYFADGRRLAEHREVLWEAMVKLRPESVKKYNEYPMQHIARVVEKALKRLARGETWSDVMSMESWLTSLASVGFSDHMRIIGTTT